MDYKRFFSCFIFIILVTFQSFFTVNGGILKRRSVDQVQVEENKNTSSVDVDNRFNFNYNRGHAHAFSPNGGFSNSDALTYGVNVGIERPGYGYRPLYSDSGAYSNSFGTPGGPHTWANGNSRVRPGYAGGYVNSGFSGGRGHAQSDSFSAVHRIPLNPFDGTVLLHNLPTKKEKDTPSSESKDKELPSGESTDTKEKELPSSESTENKEKELSISESTENKEKELPSSESIDNKELVLSN